MPLPLRLKRVLHKHSLTRHLPHDVQAVPQQQVVHSMDGTAQAVLYRQRGALRHPLRRQDSGRRGEGVKQSAPCK